MRRREGTWRKIAVGVTITVVSTTVLALWPAAWRLVSRIASWLWTLVVEGWALASTPVPFWAIPAALVAVPAAVVIGSRTRKQPEDSLSAVLSDYTSDTIYGVSWRWSWNGKVIVNLWTACQKCDAELVPRNSYATTELICEPCSGVVTGSPPASATRSNRPDGDSSYRTYQPAQLRGNLNEVLAAVEREILRRARQKLAALDREPPTGGSRSIST